MPVTAQDARNGLKDLFEFVAEEINPGLVTTVSWENFQHLPSDIQAKVRARMDYYIANPLASSALGATKEHDFVVVTWNTMAAEKETPPEILTKFREEINPDVVLLQEIISLEQAQTMAAGLGLDYVICSDFNDDSVTSVHRKLEVAIASRYPITEAKEFDYTPDGAYPGVTEYQLTPASLPGIAAATPNRGFLVGTIEEKNLVVINTHLKSSVGASGADDLENAQDREFVVSAIAQFVVSEKSANPNKTYLVGGDFNVGENDPKNGIVLTEDNLDGYDETRALLEAKLVGDLEMQSLTLNVDRSYKRSYGTIGPIDALYIDGPQRYDFAHAYRTSSTFGSDHYPLITVLPATTTGDFSPSVNWSVYLNKLVKREWGFQLVRWENALLRDDGPFTAPLFPEPWPEAPGAKFFIGPIPVTEPSPVDITIVQNYAVGGAGTLRTETEPLVRDTRVRTRIDIDVIYPTIDKINNDFRQTLACLKGCPFTTLRGPMIREALLKKFDNDEVFELAVKAVQEQVITDDIALKLGAKYGRAHDATNRTQISFLEGDTTAVDNLKEQLENNRNRIGVLDEVYREAKSYSSNAADNYVVTVMFEGVRLLSVPNHPKAIRARYTFWLVNDLAISEYGIRFKDSNGDPTDDIRQCVWLKKYIDLVYLDPKKPTGLKPIRAEDTNKLVLRYTPPAYLPDSNDPDFRFVFTTDIKYVDKSTVSTAGFSPRTCTFVSAGFDTKTAMMPLDGEDIPGAQYLGRKNASGQIVIVCDLDGVEALTHLKNSVQHWLRTNIKQDREHWVVVENPIINAIGVDKIVITAVVYKPVLGQPGLYEVSLDWVENRVRASARETLVYHSSGADDNLIISFMEYLWALYEDSKPNLWDNRQKDAEVQAMFNVIFGRDGHSVDIDGDELNGVFNRDVIRAAVLTDREYGNRHRERLALDWFNDNFEGSLKGLHDFIMSIDDTFYRDGPADRRAMFKTYNIIEGLHRRYGEFTIINKDKIPIKSPHGAFWHVNGTTTGLPEIPANMPELHNRYFNFTQGFRDPVIFYGDEDDNEKKIFYQFYTGLMTGSNQITKTGWDKMVDILIHRPNSMQYADVLESPLEGFESSWAPGDGDTTGGQWMIKRGLAGGAQTDLKSQPWSNENLELAYKKLRAAVMYLVDEFPGWHDYEKAKRAFNTDRQVPITRNGEPPTDEELSQLSCYPDMYLPTYKSLFTVDGFINPVWDKFAPTYREMGRMPPPDSFSFYDGDDVYDLVASSLNDFVEPSFFYHSTFYKKQIARAEQSFILDVMIGRAIQGSTLQVAWDFLRESYPGNKGYGTILSYLQRKEADTGDGSSEVQKQLRRLRGVGLKDGEQKLTHVYLTASDRGVPIGRLVSAPGTKLGYKLQLISGEGRKVYSADGLESLDLEDPKQVGGLIEKGFSQIKDDKFAVRRMFPTFRVRLIDFSTGWYSDNMYDYNAVRSIAVTQDKYDADLALIELMNITGVLDTDKFLTKSEIRNLGIDPSEEPKDQLDPKDKDKQLDFQQGQIFRKMKLREGTSVQILMGYHSNPGYLDTVFTGRISQVQPGNIVKIVAQGYKTELLNEVSWQRTDVTPRQIVQRTFQSLDGENATSNEPGEVKFREKQNGTPHLGSRADEIGPKQSRQLAQFMRSMFGNENLREERLSEHQAWYGKFVDNVLKAVPSIFADTSDFTLGWGWNDPVISKSILGYKFADLFTDNPDRLRNCHFENQTGGERDWVSVYQPAFDSLSELVRFQPGWVCQVLPYDHLGTLYIGPSEGEYFYTSKYNKVIVDQLRKVPRAVRSSFREILGSLTNFNEYIDENSYELFQEEKNKDSDSIKNLRRTIRFADSNAIWSSISNIEKRSEALGNMAPKHESLQSQQPALLRYAVPAFFGFDAIEDENMPLEIRKEFWDAIEDILLDRGSDYIDRTYQIHPGFTTQYKDLFKSTRADIEAVIDDMAFAGHFTDFRIGGSGSINTNDRDVFIEGATVETRVNSPKMRWDGTILEKMIEYYYVFRWWFSKLYDWAMDTSQTGSTNDPINTEAQIKVLNDSLADKTWMEMRPDRKTFRDYHLISSRTDIIKNNIVATTREMYNSVLVRYPDQRNVSSTTGGITTAQGGTSDTHFVDHGSTTWKDLIDKPYGIPFHDNLQLEERKLLISLEKNAYFSGTGVLGGKNLFRPVGLLDEPNAYLAAAAFLSLMGDALRPMYRGNIIIWGKVMKPYDWVRILDVYNEMRGTIEVEKVIHNFNSDTGWTTTVIPQAVVHVNNAVGKIVGDHTFKLFKTLNTVLDVWEAAEWMLAIWSLGLGKLVSAGLRKGSAALLKKAAKEGIEHTVGKKVVEEAVNSGSKTLLTKALEKSKLMDLNKFMVGKMGVNWKKLYKHGIRGSTLRFIGDFTGAISECIATNDIPDLSGVVSVTPLIYQGRPLIAGLKQDDHIYKTRWDLAWKSIGDVFSDAAENLASVFTESWLATLLGAEPDEGPLKVDAGVALQLENTD